MSALPALCAVPTALAPTPTAPVAALPTPLAADFKPDLIFLAAGPAFFIAALTFSTLLAAWFIVPEGFDVGDDAFFLSGACTATLGNAECFDGASVNNSVSNCSNTDSIINSSSSHSTNVSVKISTNSSSVNSSTQSS